jgi:uncharacterized repeat protein (TIGR01451 family)
MRRAILCVVVMCAAGLSSGVCPVWAAEGGAAAPGWAIYSRALPSNFSAAPGSGTEDSYVVMVRNSGSLPSNGGPVTISDRLPAGVTATRVEGLDMGPGFKAPAGKYGNDQFDTVALECVSGGSTAACTDDHAVPPGDTLYMSMVVRVSGELPEGSQVRNIASVFGGGAPSASTSLPTQISSAAAPYGWESFNAEPTGLNGLTDTQAGDHPYEFTVSYYLNTAPESESLESQKDVVIDLPPGFVGNPQVVAKCPIIAAEANVCPASTQIGVARLDLGGDSLKISGGGGASVVPIFNVVPEKGVAAEFMFEVGPVPIALYVNVNHETNYAVRVTVSGIPRAATVAGVTTTFFGEPLTDANLNNRSVGGEPLAFLQNPVDCAAGPLLTQASTDTWQHPGSYLPDGSPNLADPNWKTITATTYPSLTGCEMLTFAPSVTLTPETTEADEPTGVTVDVHVPQATDRFPDLVTPELKNATVTLPEGISVSPSAADGLQGCGDAQIALESIEPGTCPHASVLGTVKIHTPLLEGPLEGQVYLGTPNCDPCTNADAADGNMLRIFIEAQGEGVRIKKEGRIYANPSTGQLTTRFEENPELPAEDIELQFKGGLRAGLATPQTCGSAMTTSDLVPWSTPVTPDANPISSFNVDWNGEGGACPAVTPFSPSFSAGTSNPNAGQFSPFTLTFGREDREQDLAGIQVRMPEGLLGTLTGIPLCGEPQASLGTCEEASRIGSMTVAAGAGGHPFYEKGAIYLTGPYDGAPFGLSIVVPTVAGPFNLGNVVVRARIDVNPDTAALTVTSDPFPQILDGIPLRLRTANVTIDRPGFIFNPTNCAQLQVEATITSAQGAQAQVSAPFAVAGCAGLHFGPTFKVSTSGRTSRADGASLDARLTFPTGPQSNVAHVKVELPKVLPSRLTTLQKACPAATFESNPASCPVASIIGIARATTPVLPVALTGPAYFVSHGGEAFPNLIVVLQGYGARIDLIGDTFISKAGITSSTFTNVPDVQVTSFELYLPEGPDSALAANGNLCKQKLLMPSTFTAQDGAQLKQDTKIQVTGCPTATTAKAARRRRAKVARAARHRHHAQRRSGQ